MTYIPKNKIQTDLYTSGGEYIILSSGQNYIGYYHKLYNGKFFTGKTPNESDIKELIVFVGNEDLNPDGFNISSTPSIPYNPILPTEKDYQVGEFVRYFSIKRNQPIYIEIDKDTYSKYQARNPQVPWKLYKAFSLIWKLTGDVNQVAQVNKNITELTETQENIFGLGLYLKENWIQYYKKS
jgi:hypothetical protein